MKNCCYFVCLFALKWSDYKVLEGGGRFPTNTATISPKRIDWIHVRIKEAEVLLNCALFQILIEHCEQERFHDFSRPPWRPVCQHMIH
jgi:hypothetical protein